MLRHHEYPIWQATHDIRHCFIKIAKAVAEDNNSSSASRLAAYINELFVSVLEMLRRSDIKLDPSLSSTSRAVELFLSDLRGNSEQLQHPWTLKSMSKHCGLAETRFRDYCKKLTNMTPSQFLETCRIETAARLLTDKPDMTVTDIAMTCGFGSSQYFATVFRQYHGCSPRSFRKMDD